MKKTTLKKALSLAITAGMIASLTTGMITASAEEESYDFGGQVVKVYGGNWNKLDPDSTDDNTVYLDYAAQVEEKYNIVLQYTYPEGYDGYNESDIIISSLTSGEGCVDILAADMDALIALIGGGYIADITDTYEQLQVGSLYTDAVTWQGNVYGLTFDNIGDTYMLVYSRDYLEEIGMDVTPTEKFLAGEWSYDDCIEYLTELKAKLPDGVYPISTHYFHWATMAGSANGVEAVNSDGTIGITDENYIEAMEFYTQLIELGLAAPMEVSTDENGDTSISVPYGTSDLNTSYVMTMVEMWQLSGLQDSIGEFGIVYWPWGSNVTCDGDYTTLSDTYKIAQAYWSPTVVISDAAERTGIDDITLFMIAKDYNDLCNPSGATAMYAAWEAEQAGEEAEIGFEAGTVRSFCTVEDYELYDWGHTRVTFDWAKTFDDAGVVDIWSFAADVLAEGQDARSTAESYYNSGLANMQDLGLVD
ncbi:MAG: hypothetical protein LUF35_08935 [Lachnospiraceae bacterium]|nr:hypothetical protein [Lachnospiraceae bacterium]